MHTIDTIMSKIATFRVHIAPLGFEIDRIVLPLKETKADKLWLLVHEKTAEDKSGPYLEKIKKDCKKIGVELKISYADRLNMFKIIKSVKEIIAEEEGNYIYINVASGSKIQAIACMMACMILKECKNLQPFTQNQKSTQRLRESSSPLESRTRYRYQLTRYKLQNQNYWKL